MTHSYLSTFILITITYISDKGQCYEWSCVSNSCTLDCHGTDCLCSSCSTNDWVCRDARSQCIFNCNDENSCENVRIWSAADTTIINCNAPNACKNLIFYCGYPPFLPTGDDPNGDDLIEFGNFNGNVDDCIININANRGWKNGKIGCDDDNEHPIDNCIINVNENSGDHLTSDMVCGSMVQDCTINCAAGQNCNLLGDKICRATNCNIPVTVDPTPSPTPAPTSNPTPAPTYDPSDNPTPSPTDNPTPAPTNIPTDIPTPDPTNNPTKDPTNDPTFDPTIDPTSKPTIYPTVNPSIEPTIEPTTNPTHKPSDMYIHTLSPTIRPSVSPSIKPTLPTERLIITEPTTAAEGGVNGNGNTEDQSSSAINDNENKNDIPWLYVVIGGIIIMIILCLLIVFYMGYKKGQNKNNGGKGIKDKLGIEIATINNGGENSDNNNYTSNIVKHASVVSETVTPRAMMEGNHNDDVNIFTVPTSINSNTDGINVDNDNDNDNDNEDVVNELMYMDMENGVTKGGFHNELNQVKRVMSDDDDDDDDDSSNESLHGMYQTNTSGEVTIGRI